MEFKRMNILLIDVDSKIPNLALMKVSTYYKRLGHNVGFKISNPDMIYMSIIHTKNKHKADGLKMFYPNAQINVGGTGYDISKKLPYDIENCLPDYTLYPNCDYYLGFTSRGCIRNCKFCFVPRKEGMFHIVKDIKDIVEGSLNTDKIVLMDNNIFADKEHFIKVANYLIDNKMKVDFNQGLDIRLLDNDFASILSKLKPISAWRFSFDHINEKNQVLKGIEILKQNKIDLNHKCSFYVYCDNKDDVASAVERCNILKEHKISAFSMINPTCEQTFKIRKLKDWTRPWTFWSCTFNEFCRGLA